MHSLLSGLPFELRLQHSPRGLQAQAVDVPALGVPLACELQLFPLQGRWGGGVGRLCFGRLQIGAQRDRVGACGLGFEGALHGRPCPGAVQQGRLQVLNLQLPSPPFGGLLALALQLACSQSGLGLLDLPQTLGVACFQVQLGQGQALQVPGSGQQVFHLCFELPGCAIGQQPSLTLQSGLWGTRPQRRQVECLPLAFGLHHRLCLPRLDLRLQRQMNLVLCPPQSALPGCGVQLGLHRELGLGS